MDVEGRLGPLQLQAIENDENHEGVTETTDIIDSVPDQEPLETIECSVINEVLQYAYQNNLTTDYLLNSFSLSDLFGNLVRATFPRTGEDGFTDSTGLTELEIPDIVLRENLSLTDPACRLISEAYYIPRDEEVEEFTCRAHRFVNTRGFKLELPIIRSDNDWDLGNFKTEQSSRQYVPVKNHRLPLDTPDNDAGEGMELPASVRSESELLFQNIQAEKLGVTKDALKFLADQLRVDVTREDLMSYLVREAKYEKNPALKKLSPPVSPKLSQEHFIPPANACLIPMPSDDSSLLNENFKAIEEAMLTDYQDQWSEITSPVRELLETEYPTEEGMAFLEEFGAKLDDLKVEIPLVLESISNNLVPPENDAFKAFSLTELDLDPEFEMAVLTDLPDDLLGESFQKLAEETTRSLEQEQLQRVDAVARVPIPVMDFSVPKPGWDQPHMNERGILKWVQAGKEELYKPPEWHVHKADESKLIWKPLGARIPLVLEEENMDDGERLEDTFTTLPTDMEPFISVDFINRASHFTVLQNDAEEEEIETLLAHSKPRKDLMEIVRKRSHGNGEGIAQKKPRHITDGPSPGQSIQSGSLSLLPGDSPGTSGKLLANFMEIHAPKKKWSQSKYFASQENEPADVTVREKGDASIESPKWSRGQRSGDLVISNTLSRTKAPCPVTALPSTPLTVFISIKIPRRLIRTLEGLVPELNIVERDYDAYNTSIWRPGSVARSVVVPLLANDADIMVSPSTGIIVTNMIKVRQRPRAGTNKGMVQTRIEKASLRHGQLVVLVGGEGGSEDDLLQMSQSDSAAFTELQGFATGLDCDVQVYYIGGGDSTLARWVAFCIGKYGTTDHGLQTNLLEVETLWELFLRRAGFNVYAAQAVVSQLKPLDGETSQPEKHGLGAFVKMTRAERLYRFGQLVSPRVLERVGSAVDEVWNQG